MRIRFASHGIELEKGLLWLDATKPKPVAVVTHAHGDHMAKHERILCTPETGALMRRRLGTDSEFLELPYGKTTRVGDLEISLHSAGHILGSAMVLVRGPGRSLLYTGDAKPEGGLTCPPADPQPADILITEATFGREDYRFPPAEKTRAEMVAFARDSLAGGSAPVFLAYSLGKAQEVMAALCAAEIPVAAHGAPWNLCDIYRRLGITFPGSRRLSKKDRRRAAIVVSPRFLKSPEVQGLAPLRVAAVTGWGDRARAPGVEHAFPLSDHADFDGLLQIVDAVKPTLIHVLHGYAKEFSETLRERGYDARAVEGHSGPVDGTIPGMFKPR